MQTIVQPKLGPVVQSSAGGGVGRAPFVIASIAPGFAIEDTSLPSLRERFVAADQAASLIVLSGTEGVVGARAIETIVGYFQLAQPSPRATLSSIPGLRGGLKQALEMGRDRSARVNAEGLDLAVIYLAFPRLYLATIGRMACLLLRGGQLTSLAPGGPADESLGSSRLHLRAIIDRAFGRATAEATQVRRVALRRGDRLALSTHDLARADLAPSIAAILSDAADARAAARALQDLLRELLDAGAGGEPATVIVTQAR
jgi:hypothetical protein